MILDTSINSSSSTVTNSTFPAIDFIASDKSIGVVFSPENTCCPYGFNKLDGNHAIILGSKCYIDPVGSSEAISQLRSCDSSRAYTGGAVKVGANADAFIPVTSLQKWEYWVEKDLHKIIAVRILVTLPNIVKDAYQDENLYNNRLGSFTKTTSASDRKPNDLIPAVFNKISNIESDVKIMINKG